MARWLRQVPSLTNSWSIDAMGGSANEKESALFRNDPAGIKLPRDVIMLAFAGGEDARYLSKDPSAQKSTNWSYD